MPLNLITQTKLLSFKKKKIENRPFPCGNNMNLKAKEDKLI